MKILLLAPAGWATDALCGMVRHLAPGAELLVAADARLPEVRKRRHDLIILNVDGDAAEGKSLITDVSRKHARSRIVALGNKKNGQQVASLRSAGAHGYLPNSLSETEIRDSLRLIIDSMTAGKRIAASASSAPDLDGDDSPVEDQFHLTPRQTDVLALACEGKRNSEIAQALNITLGTVKLHMTAAFKALKVENRIRAIKVAGNLHGVTVRRIRKAESGKLDLDWLLGHMTHQHLPRNTVVFRMGDLAGELYYLQRGAIRLKEINKDLPTGDVFGEIGIFSPDHRRTSTAVCTTDAEVFKLTSKQVKNLCLTHPEFSFFIVNLITQRLIDDRDRPAQRQK